MLTNGTFNICVDMRLTMHLYYTTLLSAVGLSGREGQSTLLEVCIMFELHNAHAETEKAEDRNGSSTTGSRRGWGLALDICMVVLMGGILFWGATSQFPNQFNDVTRYQCYAVAFWHGTPGLTTLPQNQCAFLTATPSSTLATSLKGRGFPDILGGLVESQQPPQPLHAHPRGNPLLT